MNKFIFIVIAMFLFNDISAQETIYPAAPQTGTFYITHGTIHVGNGNVIKDGTIKVTNGKIESVGNAAPAVGARVVDASGKHIYPGIISPITNLGLKETGAGVRGSNDYDEIGVINPSIRAIVAYNTDSKIINVLRSNGILLANVVPQDEGSVSNNLITGTSSVVQLDAWNWEDAAYKMDANMHFNMPSLLTRTDRFVSIGGSASQADPVKAALAKVEKVK
ncbi:MAG: amidohydrolase, partial [Ferruginibacter sp.]